MHEVRVPVPRGSGAAVVKAALEVGIGRVINCPVIQAGGPHSEAEIVSVETSTPRQGVPRSHDVAGHARFLEVIGLHPRDQGHREQ